MPTESDSAPVALGMDFGTESVRVVCIDAGGRQLGVGTCDYAHGQIVDTLPDTSQPLPERFALQCPGDWIDAAAAATREAVADIDPRRLVGIGVDFTSCTMLPTRSDGTPLCEVESLAGDPLAWPKLWKHHGAIDQTERMNALARARDEPFLKRYGGVIGLEWFFPKLLETIEESPSVADAAEVWLEAGDWFVWRLTGTEQPTRSTCQAGYKALWSADDGYPPADYLAALHPQLAQAAASKMPGHMKAPGEAAGTLNAAMAERFGLPAGLTVSAATIDAHAAVPGVGEAAAGTLVMVMGTSSCHMLNASHGPPVDGVAGIVEGGILPGLFGYETGQAAVGDAFAWLLRLLGEDSFDALAADAMALPPGAGGVRCLDWMNGCRTPLMDGSVKGVFSGLTLATTPAHLYRALLEGSAFGVRWIVDTLRGGGVAVERFVATGGLPHHNPSLVQVYADALGTPIETHPSDQACAVGAAVLGMFAAGPERSGFDTIAAAASAMAAVPDDQKRITQPNDAASQAYEAAYADYRRLAAMHA